MEIHRLTKSDELEYIQHITSQEQLHVYEEQLKRKEIAIFVFMHNDALVGKVCVSFDTHDLRTIRQERVYFSDLYIVPSWRGQRMAQRFLAQTINELKEEGYTGFSIQDSDDPAAIRIRKKFGFTDDWETFYVKSN